MPRIDRTDAPPEPSAPVHPFLETTSDLYARAAGLAACEALSPNAEELTRRIASRASDLDRVARAVAAGTWAPPADRPGESPEHALRNLLGRVQGFTDGLKGVDWGELFGRVEEDQKELVRLCRRGKATLSDFMAVLAEAAGPAAPPAPDPCACPPDRDRARILVVEDDAETRQTLCEMLDKTGYEAHEARNGDLAVRLLAEGTFDLVLLDLGLPRKDGLAVLNEMRGVPATQSVPVLMVSGEPAREVECIRKGADDFLTKPVEETLLQAKVRGALHRRELHLRELEQFFPRAVAREFRDKKQALYQGKRYDGITVLFADIRGFSRLSAGLNPGKTVEWVNAVMEQLSECVLGHDGVLVDFIGDELMAMWGAPHGPADHEAQACRAALAMLARLPGLSAAWRPVIGAETRVGIGISSGEAQVGNTGTIRKPKYGPLGTTVNLASRVQGATKYLKADLIVAKPTRDRLGTDFAARRMGWVRTVNLPPVELYEVTASDRPGWAERAAAYERALSLYENGLGTGEDRLRDLHAAAAELARLIDGPGTPDGPVVALMARVMEALVNPAKWSREFDLPGK